MDERDRIVEWVAKRECEQIARSVVRDVRRLKNGMQSGDDSGLKNLWDEVCVQMQQEQSYWWDLYADMISGMIEKHIDALSEELRNAIWFQTDNGSDWVSDRASNHDMRVEEAPYSREDIVSHILNNFVLKLAAGWKNKRIERFIDEGREF